MLVAECANILWKKVQRGELLKEEARLAAFQGAEIELLRQRSALRFGHWFGTSAEFWLNLQSLYELSLARQEVGDGIDRLPRRMNHKRQKV